MDNPFQSPAILSFCPGILGLERGLERAIGSFTVAAYVEIEAFIIANLVAAMETGLLAPAPVWTDAKTFNAAPFRGKIHGIIGGYPCQPFSVAGNQRGAEDPRHLFPYLLKHIDAAKPVWCFFENVRGHLNMGYDEVYRSLRNLGFAVECGIYSAEEVGAPHERERLFILAIMDDAKSIYRRLFLQPGQPRQTSAEPARSSGEIPDAFCIRRNEGGIPNGEDDRPESGTNNKQHELGNSNQQGLEIRFNEPGNFSVSGESLTRRQPYGTTTKNKELADTNLRGSEQDSKSGEFRVDFTKQSSFNSRFSKQTKVRKGLWPSKPSEEQHSWEEKRVIESGMGCTVDGYNFREDLLRAYGNSVVEQTAELAFIDLLSKHLK